MVQSFRVFLRLTPEGAVCARRKVPQANNSSVIRLLTILVGTKPVTLQFCTLFTSCFHNRELYVPFGCEVSRNHSSGTSLLVICYGGYDSQNGATQAYSLIDSSQLLERFLITDQLGCESMCKSRALTAQVFRAHLGCNTMGAIELYCRDWSIEGRRWQSVTSGEPVDLFSDSGTPIQDLRLKCMHHLCSCTQEPISHPIFDNHLQTSALCPLSSDISVTLFPCSNLCCFFVVVSLLCSFSLSIFSFVMTMSTGS